MFGPVTSKPTSNRGKSQKTDQKELQDQTTARLHLLIDAWYADEDNAAKQLSKGQVQNWIFESMVEGENVVRVDRGWYNPKDDDDRKAMRFVDYMANYKGRGTFEVSKAGYDELARLFNVTPEAVAGYAKKIKDAGKPLDIEYFKAYHERVTR